MNQSSDEHPAIEFRKVSYTLKSGRELLRGLDLKIRSGETLLLLGRSGSGKTTTLRLINRLLETSQGEVLVEGKPVSDWNVISLRRRIGYVIQDIGLFPHFTVERNIGLIPKIEGWAPARISARVRELLEIVGLDSEVATRYPRELSGGQRQRVGVARALAADPPILLMDEPFGALDPITRSELQNAFLALQQRLRKTVVFVTHDLREALLLGSRIALMDSGRLVAINEAEQFVSSADPLVTSYVQAFAGRGPGVDRGAL